MRHRQAIPYTDLLFARHCFVPAAELLPLRGVAHERLVTVPALDGLVLNLLRTKGTRLHVSSLTAAGVSPVVACTSNCKLRAFVNGRVRPGMHGVQIMIWQGSG